MSRKSNCVLLTISLLSACMVSAQDRDPTAPLGGWGRKLQTKTVPVVRAPRLDAVLCQDTNPCTAFINGRKVNVGQYISGYQVKQIKENSVTLRRNGRVLSLTVFNEQVVQ